VAYPSAMARGSVFRKNGAWAFVSMPSFHADSGKRPSAAAGSEPSAPPRRAWPRCRRCHARHGGVDVDDEARPVPRRLVRHGQAVARATTAHGYLQAIAACSSTSAVPSADADADAGAALLHESARRDRAPATAGARHRCTGARGPAFGAPHGDCTHHVTRADGFGVSQRGGGGAPAVGRKAALTTLVVGRTCATSWRRSRDTRSVGFGCSWPRVYGVVRCSDCGGATSTSTSASSRSRHTITEVGAVDVMGRRRRRRVAAWCEPEPADAAPLRATRNARGNSGCAAGPAWTDARTTGCSPTSSGYIRTQTDALRTSGACCMANARPDRASSPRPPAHHATHGPSGRRPIHHRRVVRRSHASDHATVAAPWNLFYPTSHPH
jgi:hypothetical protein